MAGEASDVHCAHRSLRSGGVCRITRAETGGVLVCGGLRPAFDQQGAPGPLNVEIPEDVRATAARLGGNIRSAPGRRTA